MGSGSANAFNVTVAGWERRHPPLADVFEVWECNWPAVEMFLDCATQWRFAGMTGVPTGMDYSGLLALMEMRGLPPALRGVRFDELRVMESAYLRTLASLK